ncbi:MAG: hypothetical protein KDD85_11860 [Parvularculaceae bacterium]|nr:hypothetical protein [Parvularculaceae bacterium]
MNFAFRNSARSTLARGALAFAFIAFSASMANARPFDEIMTEARAAFVAEDFAKAADLLDEAQIDRPYSLYLARNRILTRILTDRMDEAIAIAGDLAGRGLTLETPQNEAFDRMRAEPAFAPIAERMAQNALPMGKATLVFEDPADDLLPEALIREDGGRFLIGSVRTGAIAQSTRADGQRDVISAMGGVFDIEPGEEEIWAAVNNQITYSKAATEPPFAAIAVYNRKTGVMKREVRVTNGETLFGDLELSKNADAYVSDSITPRIMVLPHGAGKIEDFINDPRFVNLQGLALDETNGRLFVADYLAGLFVIDLKSKAVTRIANPTDAHLGGVDGLYLYKGDLIGVQNGTTPQRIIRIGLDKRGTTATSLTILQKALPEWNEPTHGFVDGDTFYYIATSNWPAYDDEGAHREGARREPLRIMSVDLN